MTRFIAAKKAYVPQPMLWNIGPVTLQSAHVTPMTHMTTKKFHNQLLPVLRAFAGARIALGVTSAG